MIFKVMKRSRRVDGKRVYSPTYYLRYRFGDMLADRWQPLGASDKEVAQKLANDFRKEWESEQAGILLPKTVRHGAKVPLLDHLEQFLGDLKQRGKAGRNGKGLTQTSSRLSLLFKECGWRFPINVTADSFICWRSSQRSLAPRTLNHYLQEAITFLNWLERNGRVTTNPLRLITKVDEAGRETRKRRALSDEELSTLLSIAPDYRSIVYFTAARTGLRYQELRSLEWRDVVFSEDGSFIHARASTTKNKKEARIPLVEDLKAALLLFKPDGVGDTVKVFKRGVPRAHTLSKDLKVAGIPVKDSSGRVVDFHSLRYTWGTFLQRNGVGSRVAMELMRHSDRKLTDKVYTDTTLLPLQEEVRKLPQLIQILTQISGETCQNVSQSGDKKTPDGVSEVVDCEVSSPPLSHPVKDGQMVEVAGVEPASLVLSYVASTCLALNLLSSLNRL